MKNINKFPWILVIVAGLPTAIFSQDTNYRETFAKAHASYSTRNFSQAKELFQKTLHPDFPLADYSHHYLGLIAFHEGNFEASRETLSRLRQHYPRSVWSYPAMLQQAKIFLAEKNYPGAIDSLRALRAERNLKNEISEETLYLLAQAQEAQGDFKQAHDLYHELRSAAPLSRWTPAARKDLNRLREKYPDRFGLKTPAAIVAEADRLFGEREYGDSETLYRKLLNNGHDIPRARVLMKLADLYIQVWKRNEAVPVLEEIIRGFPDSPEGPTALYRLAYIQWNRNDNAQALEYFRRLIERYPKNPQLDRALYASADIHESFGQIGEAVSIYDRLSKRASATSVRDDALWRLAWLYYRQGEFQQARTKFARLAAQGRAEEFRIASLFWQARTTEKLEDPEEAKRLYFEIVNSRDDSYYVRPATRALERMGLTVEERKASDLSFVTEADPPLDAGTYFHLSRARELAQISLHHFAVVELDEISSLAKQQTRLKPLLMREYALNRAYARSVGIANQLPSSSNDRAIFRYPLAYWESVQQKAQEKGLDPYLIVALIRQESLFDVRARSPAFALGLMQLLPSTAARVAKQLGLPTPSNESLFEPELNLTLGTQYLKDLLQRYSNNWFKALAAYNAGENAIDRWQREIITDDPDEFIERIPYAETRAYVKLVMRNHRIYSALYTQR